MKFIFFVLLFLSISSCSKINIELKDKLKPNDINIAPIALTFTPAAFNEDTESTLTLSYTDSDNDLATTCSLSSLSNITVSTPCACSAGSCSVGVTGITNYNGAASFSYTVSSEGKTSNSAAVSLTITPVNDAPIISGTPISISTDRNTPENGTFAATDVENDGLTFSKVSDPSNGAVVVNADGTFTYTPNGSYSGVDSFQIKVNDGTVDSATVTVSVTVTTTLNCPINYVKIAANTTLGTSEFCVMTYEAKDLSDGEAHSLPAGLPWISVTPGAAQTACRANGGGYDLISNREWMSIAYLMEDRTENWSSGVVGTGQMNRGHTDGIGAVRSVSNTSDFYDQTGNSAGSGWEQKRVFYINATEYLWDFSGNVWEWTDWTAGGAINTGFTSCGYDAWFQFHEVAGNCGAPNVLDYNPLNPMNINPTTYDTSYNLGAVYGTSNPAFGMALRGGSFDAGGNSGVYSLALDAATTDSAANIGFRCVFR